MHRNRFKHAFQRREAGVERLKGILENNLHITTKRKLRGTVAPQVNFTPSDTNTAGGRRHKIQHGHARGGFAAAGFSSQPKHLSWRNAETHAIHRAYK
jgi:hypothetical protein